MSAVLTEAITGVVGIADVLGGLGVILCVLALELPLFAMPFAVFAAMLFGMLCKESALVAVPLVAWFALVASPALHPERPRRVLRALFALVATTGGLVAYTYFRRHFFPVRLPASLEHPLPASAPLAERAMHAFMAWFQQPSLPRDPDQQPAGQGGFPTSRGRGATGLLARARAGVLPAAFERRLLVSPGADPAATAVPRERGRSRSS